MARRGRYLAPKGDPAKLVSAGYPFRFPELEGALRQVLKT